MIIDCPACGAGLMFDPESGKMKCEACGSLFETYELEDDFQARGQKELQREFAKNDNDSSLKLSDDAVKDSGLKLSTDTVKDSGLKLSADAVNESGLKLSGMSGATGDMTGSTGPGSFQSASDTMDTAPSGESFNPYSDFDHPIYDHTDTYAQEDYGEVDDEEETMECNIYTCTSCGAEVAINDVEASTFCSFCGQPTVVFNRIASQKKPKYIIPFSVTKERAISLIRERLNKGDYVPEAIKNFEIERVRGIYIPFWLYDIYYHDSQYLKGTVGSGKNSHTYYYFREADCDFTRLTLDASKQLNDESSQRLEPYETTNIKPFSLEYLSGFYADTYDVKTSQLDGLAIKRAREMFQGAVNNSIEAHDISVLKSDPEYKIQRTDYAMFPAWFLTFRYEDVPYTLLVNGQTEKIIGGIPYDRAKVSTTFAVLAVLITMIATVVMTALLKADDEDAMKLLITILVLSVMGLIDGIHNLKKVKESTELTSLSATNDFVKNRGR